MQEECPQCGNRRIVAGRFFDPTAVRSQPARAFFPSEVRKHTISESRVVLQTKSRLDACLECGFLWGFLKAPKLRKLLRKNGNEALMNRLFPENRGASTRQENSLQCPACKGCRLVLGSIGDTDSLSFRPKGLKFLAFYSSDITFDNTKQASCASCVDCGIVFAHIDPNALRDVILKHGKKTVIQRVLGTAPARE